MACACIKCVENKLAEPNLQAPEEIIAEMSNPGPVGRLVGYVRSKRTGGKIAVIAKHGEAGKHAMARVAARHGG